MTSFRNIGVLSRRPVIKFTAPRSGVTIPTPERTTTPITPKQQRVNQLITNLNNISTVSSILEDKIAARASTEVLKLNMSNPEDVVVAQAAARMFPEKGKVLNTNNQLVPKTSTDTGLTFVDEITFPMYRECIQHLKQQGIQSSTANQLKQSGPFKANKTDFGGRNKDKRPDVNKASIPFAPIDLTAFIAAGIPILFGMLFPLINAAIKSNILGHNHISVSGPPGTPTPSSPGVSLIP